MAATAVTCIFVGCHCRRRASGPMVAAATIAEAMKAATRAEMDPASASAGKSGRIRPIQIHRRRRSVAASDTAASPASTYSEAAAFTSAKCRLNRSPSIYRRGNHAP